MNVLRAFTRNVQPVLNWLYRFLDAAYKLYRLYEGVGVYMDGVS